MREIASSVHKICVATSTLGLGVDAPGVRAVIHVGMPKTLQEFAQMSGRAGRVRDSSASISVVLVKGTVNLRTDTCTP